MRVFHGVGALWIAISLFVPTLGNTFHKGSCGNTPEVTLAASFAGGSYIGVYEPCCKRHDDCYDACLGKNTCDDTFHTCLTTACAGSNGECVNVAELFYTAVSKTSFSDCAYEAACQASRAKAGYAPAGSIPFASEPFTLSKGSHSLGDFTIYVNQTGQWHLDARNAAETMTARKLSALIQLGLLSPELAAVLGDAVRKYGLTLDSEDLTVTVRDIRRFSPTRSLSTLRLGLTSSVGTFELSLSDLQLPEHNSQGIRTFEEHKLLNVHFLAAGAKGEFFNQAISSAQSILATLDSHHGAIPKAAVFTMLDDVIKLSIAGCKTSNKCSGIHEKFRRAVNKTGAFVKAYNEIADTLVDKENFDGFDKFTTSTSLLLSNVALLTNNKDIRKIAVGVGLLTKIGEIGKAVKAFSSLSKVGVSVALGTLTGGLSAVAGGIGALTDMFGGGGGGGSAEALKEIAGLVVSMWQEMRESFTEVFAALDHINQNIIQMAESNRKHFEFTVDLVKRVYVHLSGQIDRLSERSAGQYSALQESINQAIRLIGDKDMIVMLREIEFQLESANVDTFCHWFAEISTWLTTTATSTTRNGELSALRGEWTLPDEDLLDIIYRSLEALRSNASTLTSNQIPLGLFKSLAAKHDAQFTKPMQLIDVGGDKWIAVAEVFAKLVEAGMKFIGESSESAQRKYQSVIGEVANVADDNALFFEKVADSQVLWSGLVRELQQPFDTIRSELASASSGIAVPASFPTAFHWNVALSPSQQFVALKSFAPPFNFKDLTYTDDHGNRCSIGTVSGVDMGALGHHRSKNVANEIGSNIHTIYANMHRFLFMVRSGCSGEDVRVHTMNTVIISRDRRLRLACRIPGKGPLMYFDYTHVMRNSNLALFGWNGHQEQPTCHYLRIDTEMSSQIVQDLEVHMEKTYLEPARVAFSSSTSLSGASVVTKLKLKYVSLIAFVLLLHPGANIERIYSSAAIDKVFSIRQRLIALPTGSAPGHHLLQELAAVTAGAPFVIDDLSIPRLPWQEELWSYLGDNRIRMTVTELQDRIKKELASNPIRNRLQQAQVLLRDLIVQVADNVVKLTREKYESVVRNALQAEQQSSHVLCSVLFTLSHGVLSGIRVSLSGQRALSANDLDFEASAWYSLCNLDPPLEATMPQMEWMNGSDRFPSDCVDSPAQGQCTALSPLMICISKANLQCIKHLLLHDAVVSETDLDEAERSGDKHISSLVKYHHALQKRGLESPPIKIGTILSILSNFSASLIGHPVNLKNAVLSIGQSGSGKSSTANARAGVQYIVVPPGTEMVDGKKTDRESLTLSASSIPELVKTARHRSQTDIPQIVLIPSRNAIQVDLMGLGDSRGKEYDMAMEVMLKKLQNDNVISTVRVVELLISHAKIVHRDRDVEILAPFNMLGLIVKQMPTLLNITRITVNRVYATDWNASTYLQVFRDLYSNNKNELSADTAFVLTHLTTDHIWAISAPTIDIIEPFWQDHFSKCASIDFGTFDFSNLTPHTQRLENFVKSVHADFDKAQQKLLMALNSTITAAHVALADTPTAAFVPEEFASHFATELNTVNVLRGQNERLRHHLLAVMEKMETILKTEFPKALASATKHQPSSSTLPTLSAELADIAIDAQVVKEVHGLFNAIARK